MIHSWNENQKVPKCNDWFPKLTSTHQKSKWNVLSIIFTYFSRSKESLSESLEYYFATINDTLRLCNAQLRSYRAKFECTKKAEEIRSDKIISQYWPHVQSLQWILYTLYVPKNVNCVLIFTVQGKLLTIKTCVHIHPLILVAV